MFDFIINQFLFDQVEKLVYRLEIPLIIRKLIKSDVIIDITNYDKLKLLYNIKIKI